MEFDLLYHDKLVSVEFPDDTDVTVVEPKSMDPDESPQELIAEALKNPLESPSFDDFIQKYDSFLIIVNDHARSTQTPQVLEAILPKLRGKRFRVIIASGTHRRPIDVDVRELILGEFYDELIDHVVFHDSKRSPLVNVGTTSRGTPVRVNSIVEGFDALIPINSIEPHYFAGYTGGRKSILPGIASFETIEANHSMALLDESRLLKLEGNPLHEDLEEAAGMLTKRFPTFAINLVQDREKKVVHVVAGNIFKQLYVGAEVAREIYAPKISDQADLVISVVHPPLDEDLYQGAKGFENARMAVKEGGILILIAACPGGIGDEDYTEMMTSARNVEEMYTKFKEVVKNYQLGWHKVGSIPPFLSTRKMWMVTEMDEATVEKMHMKRFPDVQSAVDAAIGEMGSKIDVLIIHDSGNVCPVAENWIM